MSQDKRPPTALEIRERSDKSYSPLLGILVVLLLMVARGVLEQRPVRLVLPRGELLVPQHRGHPPIRQAVVCLLTVSIVQDKSVQQNVPHGPRSPCGK